MSRLKLPGVAAIYYLRTENVWSDIELAAEAGIVPSIMLSLMNGKVGFFGQPELTESHSNDNGKLSTTTTLTFMAADGALPMTPHCVVVRTVDGFFYLIGNREHGVRLSYEKTQGTTETANLYTYTVEHSSSHPRIRIEAIE